MDAMEAAPTETLVVIRENLLVGLTRAGQTIEDGTFDVSPNPGKGACSPAQFAASLTLPLLLKVDAILVDRGVQSSLDFLDERV